MMRIHILVTLVFSSLVIGCFQEPLTSSPPIERNRYIMGTTARIVLYEGKSEDMDTAFDEMAVLESILSDYIPNSELSLVNEMAGKGTVTASPEFIEILGRSITIARETQGAFDPTIGALTIGVYRFGRQGEGVPTEAEISRAKSLVDYRHIEISGNRIGLRKEGMMLDLGGIGKGFAVDKASSILMERGVRGALVSLSGDIRVFGEDIKINIKHPRQPGAIASFMTGGENLAISTSGDYERYIERDGKVYHHILVPTLGKPGSDFNSVTVIIRGDNTSADAYATAIFAMGRESALAFLRNRTDIGVLLVYSSGEIYYNDALKSLVSDFVVH